ncbi:hypothetical protein SAMN04487904_104122 [Actinopolyspora lacussalsi subsp. righensis]|uniref:Uncharacterized protein n=1 Tax=Actinopolyspora righensis TaxID=995060 RepID=A0A1I6Z9T9_9ACTN|nr:hypothetical protein [Actinopolyspora righensis]SFT59438.1 hypothetical protein SAMN04487904_104122 [Actinopolyspora righensis]
MQQDPYQLRVRTARLSPLAEAFEVVDRYAEINHRYRKLIHDSREMLAATDVRLTQARGMGKKLMVLVRAAGSDFRERLPQEQRHLLDAGLRQADDLVYGDSTGQD